MATASQKVTLDLRPLDRFRHQFRAQVAGASGSIDRFFTHAAGRIMGMQARRFDIMSRGASFEGETWAPLKASTLRSKTRRRRRATARGRRQVGILKDTGTMRAALNAGSPGYYVRRFPGGVRLGIGGGGRRSQFGPTIGQVAGYHQRGSGRLPVRRVITTQLDERTSRGIASDLQRAVVRLGRGGV